MLWGGGVGDGDDSHKHSRLQPSQACASSKARYSAAVRPPILAQHALHKVRPDAHFRILKSAARDKRALFCFVTRPFACISRETTSLQQRRDTDTSQAEQSPGWLQCRGASARRLRRVCTHGQAYVPRYITARRWVGTSQAHIADGLMTRTISTPASMVHSALSEALGRHKEHGVESMVSCWPHSPRTGVS